MQENMRRCRKSIEAQAAKAKKPQPTLYFFQARTPSEETFVWGIYDLMFNRNAFDSRGIRNSISLIHELDFSISTIGDVQNYANRGCCARWDQCLPHCAVLPVICWDCPTSAVLLPYPDDGIQRLPCSQNSVPVRTESIRIGFNEKH